MMNFRSHPNMTKCVIPNGVNLSNNDSLQFKVRFE